MSFIVNASFALPLYACLFSMYQAIIKKQMIIRNNLKSVRCVEEVFLGSQDPQSRDKFVCLSTME